MSIKAEYQKLKEFVGNLGHGLDDEASPDFKPISVLDPWFQFIETSTFLKTAEEKCLDDIQEPLASLREVVSFLKNTCSVYFLEEQDGRTALLSQELKGDQVRVVTVLRMLDQQKFSRFSLEVMWVQRFFRFAKSCAALRDVRHTKSRKERQVTAQFAAMFSELSWCRQRLMSFWTESCKQIADTLFPTADSTNVMTRLAAVGRGLGVKMELCDVEKTFEYAEKLCNECVAEWTEDVQGLIGLLQKSVLPDLGETTVNGILTPEFAETLKTVENETLFKRSVNGATILREWSKHLNSLNEGGSGVVCKPDFLRSMDDVLKQCVFFADLATAVRVILRELPLIINVAARKKKAQEFKAKNTKNAAQWGDSVNTALQALVDGQLPALVDGQVPVASSSV